MRRLFLVVAVLGCAACAGGENDDAQPVPETSVVEDTAGAADTFAVDTVPVDTAAADTTVADTEASDTNATDAAVADTAKADTLVADTFVADTSVADTAKADADAGWSSTAHVHIYITNTCAVTTSPTSFDVPAGATVKVSWHNHSVDYRADVWASYGGGYLALEKGATWNETYEHCFIKSTHTEYVDVSPEGSPSSCGKQRVYFYCHA